MDVDCFVIEDVYGVDVGYDFIVLGVVGVMEVLCLVQWLYFVVLLCVCFDCVFLFVENLFVFVCGVVFVVIVFGWGYLFNVIFDCNFDISVDKNFFVQVCCLLCLYYVFVVFMLCVVFVLVVGVLLWVFGVVFICIVLGMLYFVGFCFKSYFIICMLFNVGCFVLLMILGFVGEMMSFVQWVLVGMFSVLLF